MIEEKSGSSVETSDGDRTPETQDPESMPAWTGRWEPGALSKFGYVATTERYLKLKAKGFSMTKAFAKEYGVSLDAKVIRFNEIMKRLNNSPEKASLNQEDLDVVLQINSARHHLMDQYEEEHMKRDNMRLSQEEVESLIRPGDILETKATGTKRVVLELQLNPGLDGGGQILCETTKNNRTFKEHLSYANFIRYQSNLTIQKK